MKLRRLALLTLVLALHAISTSVGAQAAPPPISLARIVNQTDRLIRYRIRYKHGADVTSVALATGAVHHVAFYASADDSSVTCEYATGNGRDDPRQRSLRLLPGQTYQFQSMQRADETTRNVVLEAVERPADRTRPVRDVRVLIVAGPAYRRFRPQWRMRTDAILREASAHFAIEFGIRFQAVAVAAWQFREAPATADAAMEQLHRQVGANSKHDLIVAFTLFAFPGSRRGSEIRGLSHYFSRYVIVPDAWRPTGAVTRLIHELGHVFGAFHDREPGSIMAPVYRATPSQIIFSRPTIEVITATRDVDFQQGVRSLDARTARQIQRLYQTYRHRSEPPDRDPISAAYQHLADRAQWDGATEEAAALRRQAELAHRRAAEFIPSPAND